MMNTSYAAIDSLPDALRQDGAVCGPWLGRDVVLHFGDSSAEYSALDGEAGTVYMGDWTEIEVRGLERAAFLNRMATNKLDHLAPGSGCETFLTDAKGHVVAHLLVFAAPDSLVLCTAPGQAETILAHLSRYIIRDRVELQDRSGQTCLFLIAGARVLESLERLQVGAVPSDPLAHRDVHVATAAVSLRRLDAGVRTAFLLSAPVEIGGLLWGALREAGARPCGWLAKEAFRIEAGWAEHGRDITQDNLPQEVARNERTISFAKGCYLGQETVARIESRGHVNRMLVGLKFETREVPAPDTELTADGAPVGRVTSAAFSPRLGSSVALGYVRRGREEAGTRLESLLGGVEIVRLPFL